MSTGRPVKLGIACILAALCACTADAASPTDSDDGEESQPEPLTGIADLHLHMFAEEGFGGGWLHGSAIGPGEQALGPCDGGEPGDHGRLQEDLVPMLGTCEMPLEDLMQLVPLVETVALGGGPLMSEFISVVPGSQGDTGAHEDRTGGWPDLESWPRWDAIAHQQSWEQHLRRAYDGGLRLEVMSAVTFDFLCRATPEENRTRPDCDEAEDTKVQLRMANEFALANDWVEVALSGEEARRIISEDKLALVLSIEADHLMNDGDWRAQLDEFYDLGVRTLQPIHQVDNRWGGAALHNTIFHLAQYAENCHIDYDCALTSPEVTLGFDVDADCKNTVGLSDEGKELVQAMMDRGMLVDAAHMSEKSTREFHELSVANDYYPMYISHGHFREIMLKGKGAEEKTSPAWVIEMIRETGGMFGLRTSYLEVNDYERSPVSNTCHGSSRSFAQAYDYGRLGLKVSMGFGSDFNGFIQQTRPRFGPQACSASFEEEADCQARDERASGVAPLGTDFDEIGLGHVGTLPDLLDDLDALGSDTTPLRNSADDFVRMWERAEGSRPGPADLNGEIETDGIAVQPLHGTRLAEYPTECDEPFCPSSLLAGTDCRFDAECVSGTCADAGPCGVPVGHCE